MTEFCGWDMPVQYPKGIIVEAKAVREAAGIFDVSHMGRIEFEAGKQIIIDVRGRLVEAEIVKLPFCKPV